MKKELWNRGWVFWSDIDAERKSVDLPHDAMQTEKRIPELKDGTQSGFYPGGLYTYEKEFSVDEKTAGLRTILEFEGVYMKSSVYLNGELLGGRVYGYSDFFVDLTGKIRPGSNNVRVVADNTQCANSRWYSGSGIYRDVWMHTSGEEYIRPDGIKVTTKSIDPAVISVSVDAAAEKDSEIIVKVAKDGTVVASGKGNEMDLTIPDARLWSAETPELYEVTAEIIKKGKVIDSASETTGIRVLKWDAVRGFQVNGKTVNFRGGCVHHDHGCIGAAEYDAACERRIRIMKQAGFNAVRTAHNPTSRAMLRACDKLGMYVMNESFDTWAGLKSPYDYAMYFRKECERDLADMIRVSYNHPSVVMYSIGNEVYLKNVKFAIETSNKLASLCKKLDSSRPVLNAINPLMVIMGDDKDPEAPKNDKVDPRACGEASGLTGSALINVLLTNMDKMMKLFGNERKMRKINDVMKPLDIVGYNYGSYLYEAQHKDYPDRVLVGSETFPAAIYDNWNAVKSMPWLTGDFVWTAWDYLGECGAGMPHYGKMGTFTQPFPTISAGCANIDLTGEIQAQGYYAAVVYGEYDKPYIAVHPLNHSGEKAFMGRWRSTDALHSWDWDDYKGVTANVDVYSKASMVELIINGRSVGRRVPAKNIASFVLQYEPGELKAVQYDAAGRITGEDVIISAGTEKHLRIEPEKKELGSTGVDLLYLPIEIVDENGTRRIWSDTEVTVDIEGPATLEGIGSGDLCQRSLSPYTGKSIKTYQGRAIAVLRSTEEKGDIKVTITAPGMQAVSAVVTAC